MVIKCITNLIKDIPEEYLEYHQKTHEDDFNLTIGKEYIVTGITAENGKLLYYAELNNGIVYWVTPALFDVVDDRVPDDWVFRIEPHAGGLDFMISFLEWHEDNFISSYYEGRPREVQLVNEKVKKYGLSG